MGTIRGFYKPKNCNIIKLKKYISKTVNAEDRKKPTNNGGDN